MIKFRKIAIALVATVAFGMAAAMATAQNGEIIVQSDRPIEIEQSKGVLVRLPGPPQTVFVSDPEIADIEVKSPRLIYVYGKQPGQATLYAVDQNEEVLVNRTISVRHNTSRLEDGIRRLLPGSDVQVQSIDGTLVLSGTVATAVEAEDARRFALRMAGKSDYLVNKLEVTEPNQVHLRVRIAEVSRSVMKEFGINWDAAFRSGNFLLGLAVGAPVLAAGNLFGADRINVRNDGTNSAIASYRNGNFDVNAVIDALDTEGLVSILAEPNLTAVSGEPASFLAGGEFPILVREDDSVTVQFKQFGVALAFTPTLVGGRISLKVKPEVSELSSAGAATFDGFTVPALSTRRTETTVELGSGQSFAIAGLMQNNITRSLDKYPGLGDLPILGALFRSDSFRRSETELVVIVTPYIVRPVEPGQLAAPTDGLLPPTDVERIIHGQVYKPNLEKRKGTPTGRGASGLVGPTGFVLN